MPISSKKLPELDVIMRMRLLIIFLLGFCTLHSSVQAESRKWRSKDGSKYIVADLIRHDSLTVTVKRVDGKIFTLSKDDLHASDLDYLQKSPQTSSPKPAATTRHSSGRHSPPVDDACIFDTLKLGDSRATVQAKIKASKLLELTVDELYLGRFGLNGSYRTKQTIGGLKCLLYFGWDGGNLQELTLQTQPQPQHSYDGSLKDTWEELIRLMTTLHGKPLQAAPYPQANDLPMDSSLSSHLWRLNSGGSALLGTSRSSDGYMVSVRFTTEAIQPVKLDP